jgi:hypothetical protein
MGMGRYQVSTSNPISLLTQLIGRLYHPNLGFSHLI